MSHVVKLVQTALCFNALYIELFFHVHGSERENVDFRIWYKHDVGTLTSNIAFDKKRRYMALLTWSIDCSVIRLLFEKTSIDQVGGITN